MKRFTAFLAILATLTFLPGLQPTARAQTIPTYTRTVSVTSTNTVVTPVTAPTSGAKPTGITIQNVGSSGVFWDFGRVAVANSATALYIPPCGELKVNLGGPNGGGTTFTYGGIITASGTATVYVSVNYLPGVIPNPPTVAERFQRSSVAGCSTTTTLPASGATVASATALPVPSGQVFHVSGTTTITSITSTGIPAGSRITLIFDGILTFTDGSNLILAGNFVTTADDTITLIFDGVSFYETSRSVN